MKATKDNVFISSSEITFFKSISDIWGISNISTYMEYPDHTMLNIKYFFDIVKLDRLYVWTSQNITPLHLSPPSNINSGQWVHRQMPVSYVSGIGECGIFHQILMTDRHSQPLNQSLRFCYRCKIAIISISPPARWGSLDFIRGASCPPPSPSHRPPAPEPRAPDVMGTAGPDAR